MSLDELPEIVYAPLGTRGVQPIPLKECPKCGNNKIEKLTLVNKRKGSGEKRSSDSASQTVTVDEYDISCSNCDYNFTIRCENVYGGSQHRERIITFVHIITEDGKDEGWIGNY